MPVNDGTANVPPITPPVLVPAIVGGAASSAAGAVGGIGDAVTEALTPQWILTAGAYLTDRGTLIRIGTFMGGVVLAWTGVFFLLKTPVTKAVTSVAGVVK